MFDKQFLQILAVRLSGGLSLDWKEAEPRDRPMLEEDIMRSAERTPTPVRCIAASRPR